MKAAPRALAKMYAFLMRYLYGWRPERAEEGEFAVIS